MKIRNVPQLNDFLAAVDRCEGQVWLESPDGDRFNLKSTLSQYLALGALLAERSGFLELICSDRTEERNFMPYFRKHPEVTD